MPSQSDTSGVSHKTTAIGSIIGGTIGGICFVLILAVLFLLWFRHHRRSKLKHLHTGMDTLTPEYQGEIPRWTSGTATISPLPPAVIPTIIPSSKSSRNRNRSRTSNYRATNRGSPHAVVNMGSTSNNGPPTDSSGMCLISRRSTSVFTFR